jgi:hypothetical protein
VEFFVDTLNFGQSNKSIFAGGVAQVVEVPASQVRPRVQTLELPNKPNQKNKTKNIKTTRHCRKP